MSKNKSAKRKRTATSEGAKKLRKITESTTPPPDNVSQFEPRNLHALISQEELDITIETLQTITSHPSVLKQKACKDLRVAVYDFRQACTTGVNTSSDTNLTARISAALTDAKYTDALSFVAEMRIKGEAPKLGALCRWVRDLDVISGLSMQVDGVSHTTTPRSEKDLMLLQVLDSILRVTGTIDLKSTSCLDSPHPIALQEPWCLRSEMIRPIAHQARADHLDELICKFTPLYLARTSKIVSEVPGRERKPPNHHPAKLYLSQPNFVPLSNPPSSTTRIPHPIVPNLSMIKDVLDPIECATIIAAARAIGFTPDAPVRAPGEEISVLAHNFYWLVDQPFHDKLWSRVRPYVPEQVDGRKARSINRRFRVYRYEPGAEYRCHIDGAWPPSGINPLRDTYEYDSSPPDARQSSLFTFLIYLNDDFEGGETTFFLPSCREGIMNAYPVRPLTGSVAMFPHGETRGALLHEGTGVRKGAKYVIRTDVEYDVAPSST